MRIKCKLWAGYKTIEVTRDDTLNILLKKLNISDKNTKFIFKGETYSIASTLTFKEIGMFDNCQIFIISQIIRCGGGSDSNSFANLSEEFTWKDNVSKNNPNIPKWRYITKGINLYGICKNKNCVACGNQVIKPVDSREYNVYDEGFMGICPMCGKHFDLDTCSFYYCDYKVEGTYFDISKDDWVNLPGTIQKTSDGKDFYYDFNKKVEGKEGKVKYKKLLLKVIDIHSYEWK